MTTTELYQPPLGTAARAETGRELQATLVELVGLALIGKHMHWNVVGPSFRSVHLQLDELVEQWTGLADSVAERAAALGASPDGQADAVTGAGLPRLDPGPLADHVVVRELARLAADVSERARERMDRLGDIDLVSQDVLVDVVRALEENVWMLRAQVTA